MSNAIDEMFEGGIAGAPSFKFGDTIGNGIKGTITDLAAVQQTKFKKPDEKLFWDDGKPRMQLNVTLQTTLRNWDGCTTIPTDALSAPKPASEDDGQRRVYLKAESLRAVRVAMAQSGATGAPKKGATLGLKLTGTKPVGDFDAKVFEAMYVAPEPGADLFDSKPAQASTDPWGAAPAAQAAPASDEPPF